MKAIDVDPGLHRFRKTNLFYSTDPYLLFQDPTVLGFKLFFNFNDGDGLLSRDMNNKNTALNYLIRIGQADRAFLLNKFINHLELINNSTPWFFQEIEGLDDAWKRGFTEKEFTPLLPIDRQIKINCLESIDLRMSALIDLYRKSCFDWEYRREIVPWNLRLFNVSIYIYELRNINKNGIPNATNFINLNSNIQQQRQNNLLFGSNSNVTRGGLNTVVRDTLGNVINTFTDTITGIQDIFSKKTNTNLREESNTPDQNISRFLFEFKQCEWLPDESGDIVKKVNNGSEGEFATQTIAFSYRNVMEKNLNTLYTGDIRLDDALTRILDKTALDMVKSDNDTTLDSINYQNNTTFPMGVVDSMSQYASQYVQNFVKGGINKLLLGNVFGLQPEGLLSSASNILNGNPSEVIGGIKEVIRQGSNKINSLNGSNDVDYIGNIFEK